MNGLSYVALRLTDFAVHPSKWMPSIVIEMFWMVPPYAKPLLTAPDMPNPPQISGRLPSSPASATSVDP